MSNEDIFSGSRRKATIIVRLVAVRGTWPAEAQGSGIPRASEENLLAPVVSSLL